VQPVLGIHACHLHKEPNELFTGLIEAYIIGHTAIGMLHISLTYRERKLSNKPHQQSVFRARPAVVVGLK